MSYRQIGPLNQTEIIARGNTHSQIHVLVIMRLEPLIEAAQNVPGCFLKCYVIAVEVGEMEIAENVPARFVTDRLMADHLVWVKSAQDCQEVSEYRYVIGD